MKTHSLFAIVLMLFFTSAYSQPELSNDPTERGRQVTEWMKTNLQLTDEQVPKVEAVNVRCAEKNIELEGSKNMTKGTRQKYLLSNERYRDNSLKKILTVDQFTNYQAKKEEVMTKMMKKI